VGLLRADRCSVCGRNVRGMEDARKEGKRWYCSPSCLLQATTTPLRGRTKRKSRGPVGVLGRIVKWTLIVIGLIAVAAVVGAILGAGKSAKGKTGPGSRSDPIRVGRTAAIGGGWKMHVIGVTRNANRLVVAAKDKYGDRLNQAPPRGAQDFLVRLSLTYAGGGKDDVSLLRDFGIHAEGAHHASYDMTNDSCGNTVPKPSLESASQVFSGQTIRGNVCFQIAKNDAHSLMLYTGNTKANELLVNLTNLKTVWFALR
jgi:hypothetical protein